MIAHFQYIRKLFYISRSYINWFLIFPLYRFYFITFI